MAAHGSTGRPSAIVVGAASRDVDPTDERGWRLGGAVTYCSLAAARLGVRVWAVVGADVAAAAAPELELLRRAGVVLHVVTLQRGPVFDNRVVDGRRAQVAIEASDALPPALPAGWPEDAALMLVPIATEIDDSWADVMPRARFVALGWQGLLRRVVGGREVEALPLRRRRLADRADIAVVSAEDVVAGGPGLRELVTRAGQELVVTDGARGALHLDLAPGPERRLRGRRLPAIPARSNGGAVGAGDVFLAAWCAARLCAPDSATWRSLAVASAAGSIMADAASLADVPDARAIARRLLRPPTAASHPPSA